MRIFTQTLYGSFKTFPKIFDNMFIFTFPKRSNSTKIASKYLETADSVVTLEKWKYIDFVPPMLKNNAYIPEKNYFLTKYQNFYIT